MVKLSLVVDRPQPIYYPGEAVTGNCVVQLNGQMNLSQLTITLKGKAKCKWEESYQEDYQDENGEKKTRTATRDIDSKHECIELKYCPGHVYPTVLDPGVHNIGFTFQLPQYNLPSSFEGRHGHIRYHLKGNIHKTQFFSVDEKTKLGITIQSPAFSSVEQMMQSHQTSKNKKVGCFCGDPLSMKCQIQRSGFNIGTAIPINVFVDNGSKKQMVLKAALKQKVTFHADGKNKETDDKVADAIGNSISGNSKQSEVIQVVAPVSLPVTLTVCPIINIKYYLKIRLDIPGAIDLSCEMPVILTNEQLPIDG